MRSRWLLAAACLLLGTAAPAAVNKGELTELRGRIQALQKELEEAEESRKDAADALRSSERDISDINRRIYELEQEQHELGVQIARLKNESWSAREAAGAHQDSLGRLLYEQYLTGSLDSLQILLNTGDPNAASRRLAYYGYVARARAQAIEGFRERLARLDRLKRETELKNVELVALKGEQAKEKQKLVQSQAERRKVLTQLSRQISTQRREIGQLQRDEKRLSRLVERLGKILPKTPPPPSAPGSPREPAVPAGVATALRGKLLLPVRGELMNRYGAQRADTGSTWKGLFFRTREGEPIKAVAAGRVVFADWLRGFGNLVIVDHGNGLMSLYGNNQSIYKQVGDAARPGEVLAAAGNSGGNAEPGLYFELRHQSKTIDPMTWIGR